MSDAPAHNLIQFEGRTVVAIAPEGLEQLELENAALRADKERLDWLEKAKCAEYVEGPACWRINMDSRTDSEFLRAAIDAARKEVQP